jgi:hypothetical protein
VKKFIFQNTSLWLILSLTLGLAPFFPEPHIYGKIKWVLGGAKGMTMVDWFDLFMHGTPWLILFVSLLSKFLTKKH